MERRERLNSIFDEFDRQAEAFCADLGGLDCEIMPFYKGEPLPENLTLRVAEIITKAYIIEFRYTAHGSLDTVHSILDCAVCFGKSGDKLRMPLQFISDFCDEDIAEPMCIPYISDSVGMAQAFSAIRETVEHFLPKITEICGDGEKKQAIEDYFYAEYEKLTGDVTHSPSAVAYFSGWLAVRFSVGPHWFSLKGKPAKALKKYNKFEKTFSYEDRLAKQWQAGKTADREKIPAIADNMEWFNDKGLPKSDGKEVLAMFLSSFVIAIPASAVYIGLYFLLYLIQIRGAVYTPSPLNYPICLVLGWLTGIAISYFTRFFFYRVVNKKIYERLKEQDHILNGGGSDRIMKGVAIVAVTACILMIAVLARWDLNFKKDGFIEHRSFTPIRGTYYSYDEIDHVRYVPDRVNGYGETLDRPSYALVMKDGTEIDLYTSDSFEHYEGPLLDYLESRGVAVERRSAP